MFSCKQLVTCGLKNDPVTYNHELTAIRDGLSAVLAGVVSKIRIHKPLLDVPRLDMEAVSRAVTISNAAQDSDSTHLHSLITWCIHGL